MSSRNSLLKNTGMLYVLTAANYIFGFATIPYLTRVLGAETYGVVGFATAFATYVQLVLDFGFILSATAEVAECSDDKKSISHVVSAVMGAKALLIAGSAVVVALLLLFVEQFRAQWILLGLYFLYVSVNCLIPDFLYRGLERMEIVTFRTVAVKAVFLILVFVFVKAPEDYLLVPLFYLLGAAGALLTVMMHAKRVVDIRFSIPSMRSVTRQIKMSFSFFVSRIASTFYSSFNMMVIGFLYPGSAVVGHFSATEKAIAAGRSLSSPVADSLYPYMIRTSNYKLLFKISFVGFAILAALCIPVGLYAEQVCVFVFGSGYDFAAPILRVMLPLIPISILSYLFGFPALAPIGMSNLANISVVIGAILQVLLLGIVFIVGELSVINICICTVVTEFTVLTIRAIGLCVGLINR